MEKEKLATDIYKKVLSVLASGFKKKREEAGVKMRDLAEKSTVSSATICQLEQRSRIPRFDALIKLAVALNISVAELGDIIKKADSHRITSKENAKKLIEQGLASYKLNETEIAEVFSFINFKRKVHSDKNFSK